MKDEPISIADTGCGIGPEDLDKIFDPFFSTKFTGRGLGLSVVSGLLRSMEGAISVESDSGNGATFRLFLPMAEPEGPAPPRDETSVGSVTHGMKMRPDD
ncbi:MAG: ATP-binding protein [Syntrophobacteraceae bacterium]|jgi:signal transduction histidine kinase|nr:ATP-binding protein [Syntrophobacteraceae bacterium]